MKKIVLLAIPVFALAVLPPQILQAQGTTYLSNLDQSSSGTLAVGSDSWLAAMFQTGTNIGGYVLNSIQLAMNDASGNPTGFTAMIYAPSYPPGGVLPGSSLGTLTGSLNPVTSGIYTYTPAANLTLSPRIPYFIVLTAGTAIANGAYDWSLAGANSHNSSGGWLAPGFVWTSSNGSSWPPLPPGYPQFAINATGVPEPGLLSLLALGGIFLVWHRRKAKVVIQHAAALSA
jgi:hypothetical protein